MDRPGETRYIHETMLCPACQHTEEIEATLSSASSDAFIRADIQLKCPICNCDEMYVADKLLVSTLAELNKRYVQTHSHCAMYHPNYRNKPDTPRWRYDAGHYGGPYIMFQELPIKALSILQTIIRSKLDTIDRTKYTPLLKIHHFLPDSDIVYSWLEIGLEKDDPELIPGAIDLLISICADWIYDMDTMHVVLVPEEAQHRVRWHKIDHYNRGIAQK